MKEKLSNQINLMLFEKVDCRQLTYFRFFFCLTLAMTLFISHDFNLNTNSNFNPTQLFALLKIPHLDLISFNLVGMILILSLISAAFDFFARTALITACLSFFVYQSFLYGFFKSPDYSYLPHDKNIIFQILLILSFCPTVENRQIYKWPILLIKITLGLAYLGSAYCKLQSAGLAWCDGHSLQGFLIEKYLRRQSLVAFQLATHETLCLVLSIATLLFELSFVFLIFIRNSGLFLLPIGLTFHLMIYYFMNISSFLYFFCTCYFIFTWDFINFFSPLFKNLKLRFKRKLHSLEGKSPVKTLFIFFIYFILSVGHSLIFSTKTFSNDFSYYRNYLSNKKRGRPWTHLNFPSDKKTFSFAVVGDVENNGFYGTFEKVVSKLNLFRPDFVISTGDNIPGYSEDVANFSEQWDTFDSIVNKLKMPFFYTPGNHDYSNYLMEDFWKKRRGDSYYYFIFKNVLFLVLNTEDGLNENDDGNILDEQYKFIKLALEKNKNVKWTFFFMHRPLWKKLNTIRWQLIRDLLKNRKHTVFSGHLHRYEKNIIDGNNYFILATAGSKNNGRGIVLGEYDHFFWVTMTEHGPEFANILVDSVMHEDAQLQEGSYTYSQYLTNEYSYSAVKIDPLEKKIKNDDNLNINLNMTLNNISHTSMDFYLGEEFSEQLDIINRSSKITVPPQQKKRVTYQLRAKSLLNWDHLQPFEINYQLDFPGIKNPTKGLQFKKKEIVKIKHKKIISKQNSKLILDGHLDDWENLYYTMTYPERFGLKRQAWHGAQDLSFKYDVRYDHKFLYIGISVTDDIIFSMQRIFFPSRQDSINVRLDINPKFFYKNARDIYSGNDFYLFSICPNNACFESNYDFSQKKIKPIIKTQTSNSGYEIEMAIPIQDIEQFQGKSWKEIRLHFSVYDFDSKNNEMDQEANLQYPADLRTMDAYEGSGIYYRKLQ